MNFAIKLRGIFDKQNEYQLGRNSSELDEDDVEVVANDTTPLDWLPLLPVVQQEPDPPQPQPLWAPMIPCHLAVIDTGAQMAVMGKNDLENFVNTLVNNLRNEPVLALNSPVGVLKDTCTQCLLRRVDRSQ
eukprot:2101903-Amphidinium_carterae.1